MNAVASYPKRNEKVARRDFGRFVRLVNAVIYAKDSTDVALKLLPVLAKRGLAWPAARLIHNSIRPLTPTPGRYNILTIEKAVFNDDVVAALGAVSDVQVFGIGRAVIKAMAVGILPRHLCGDDTYISDDPAASRAKLKYRRFLLQTWKYLERLGHYDAVLTGNWAYWAERELGAALEQHGFPFIVLHKEGIKPPARSVLLRQLFRKTRGQFMGRRMLVYHEDERQHQIEGEIAREDQVVVVGMPRMDRLHDWRRKAAAGKVVAFADRPLVLCLAFLPNNFLPSYSGIDSDLAWKSLCHGTLRAMVRLAWVNPDLDVVIRPRGYEIEETNELLADAVKSLNAPVPANLKISTSGNIAPLLEAAWVVCAHNTTVIFEGMAIGKPVVVPDFAEAQHEDYRGFLVDPGPAAEYAASEDDLVKRCSEHCRAPALISAELSTDAKLALAKWTGNAEGDSAARVSAAILREIELASR
jgi:hypothetical protein